MHSASCSPPSRPPVTQTTLLEPIPPDSLQPCTRLHHLLNHYGCPLATTQGLRRRLCFVAPSLPATLPAHLPPPERNPLPPRLTCTTKEARRRMSPAASSNALPEKEASPLSSAWHHHLIISILAATIAMHAPPPTALIHRPRRWRASAWKPPTPRRRRPLPHHCDAACPSTRETQALLPPQPQPAACVVARGSRI